MTKVYNERIEADVAAHHELKGRTHCLPMSGVEMGEMYAEFIGFSEDNFKLTAHAAAALTLHYYSGC